MTLSAPCMLVIGRNGQVATALQEMGGMTGRPIVALGRKDIDILPEAAVTEALKAFDPQVIVNTAAYTAVDQAEDDKDAAYALNAEAAGQIARACERLHKPLIHLSTDYVFGTDGAPFREGDPTGPINVYGASKLEGERLVREACEQSLILRTSWVSGAHGRNFIKSMIRLSRQREVLTVVDDQRGRLTFAEDLVKAIFALSDRFVQGQAMPEDGLLHVSNEGEAVWADVAEFAMHQLKLAGEKYATIQRVSSLEFGVKAPRPADSRLNIERFSSLFGEGLPQWEARLTSLWPAIMKAVSVEDNC